MSEDISSMCVHLHNYGGLGGHSRKKGLNAHRGANMNTGSTNKINYCMETDLELKL